ncbi:MAG: histidine kinase [Saccharofermentans sp.]|nr:histidine kinase [Saccharofermentans sp.]
MGIICAFFCYMMVVLNNFSFAPQKKISTIFYILGGIALLLVTHVFFMGIVFLPLINRQYYLGALSLASGFLTHVIFERVGGLELFQKLAILVVVFAVWMLFIGVMNRIYTMESKFESVMRTSSLDGLHEKMMREQIAKQQNLKERNARLEERERISRDIHNSVGHTLSAASVTLDAASMLIEKEPVKAGEKVNLANERVHDAIESIRSAVRTLDADDGMILVKDYVSSLGDLCKNFCLDTNIKVHHNFGRINEEGKLDLDTASFLSGVLSELLTNGTKHGGATVFVAMLIMDTENVGLKVSDNGCGWGVISYDEKNARLNRGFGLRKMRDYCETRGGSFEINGEDGFTVFLNVPRRIGE